MDIITKNAKETQALAKLFGEELLNWPASGKSAMTVVLRGELGAGKTTFSQGFAKGIGILEKIKSPTFVILKRYPLSKVKRQMSNVKCFKYFYHIDCYRLKNEKDAIMLGLPEIFKNSENLLLIEWPERIKKALPKKIITVKFSHIDETTRKVSFN